MWSSVSIPGPPNILIVDAAQQELSNRLFASLSRSGLQMAGSAPVPAIDSTDFNCLVLFDHPRMQLELSHPFLLALTDSQPITAIAPIIVVPTSPVTARQIGLFYLKFFTELKLHCTDSITGKMAWFAFTKAKELLRRRRYDPQFRIRC